MRSPISLILLGALVSVVRSITVPGLPACAGACVTSFGNCNQLAVQCICSDSTLLANLACCVGSNCDAADQNTTITFADALCAGQGVTNLPSAATCAPGAASTPIGTSTASGSSAMGSSSSMASSAPASSSSAVSSAISSASQAAASASSSAPASSSIASTSASAAPAASATASSGELAYGVGSAGLGLVLAGLIAAL